MKIPPEAEQIVSEYLNSVMTDETKSHAHLVRIRASRYFENLDELIVESSDSEIAFDACILLIERYLHEDKPIPQPLKLFNLQVLNGKKKSPRKKGGSKAKNLMRNREICSAIEIALDAVPGIKEYPNRSNRDSKEAWNITACGLVSKCLVEAGIPIGFHAVKTIWMDRNKPGFL